MPFFLAMHIQTLVAQAAQYLAHGNTAEEVACLVEELAAVHRDYAEMGGDCGRA
jgi:hypothetical protein